MHTTPGSAWKKKIDNNMLEPYHCRMTISSIGFGVAFGQYPYLHSSQSSNPTIATQNSTGKPHTTNTFTAAMECRCLRTVCSH